MRIRARLGKLSGKVAFKPQGKAEWTLLVVILGSSALLFLTQQINPFPHDWWFASHEMLVEPPEEPPLYNYTPIAAPAFLYAINHHVAQWAALGLEQEMVLGVLTHHALLALATWVVFLSCKALDLHFAVGAGCALGLYMFVQTTQITQSFWSESVVLPLLCLTVYGALRLSAQPPVSAHASVAWGAALGFVLGLAVITRAVPIVMAPAVPLFLYPDLSRALWRGFSAAFLVSLAAVILIQMAWNAQRFGRFELSHSTGLHLWNAVSPDADVILADSDLYQEFKRKTPNIQQAWWWDLPREMVRSDTEFEDLIRPMVLSGIAKHPLVFLRRGWQDFLSMAPMGPHPIGYLRADYYNPLQRDRMLPAPWFDSRLIRVILERGNCFGRRVYSTGVPLLLGGGFLLAAVRIRQSEQGLADPTVRAWLLLSYTFVCAIFVSNLIERFDPRYALPYLGALALLTGVTGQWALQSVRLLAMPAVRRWDRLRG